MVTATSVPREAKAATATVNKSKYNTSLYQRIAGTGNQSHSSIKLLNCITSVNGLPGLPIAATTKY